MLGRALNVGPAYNLRKRRKNRRKKNKVKFENPG